jgi:hypothetical protein
LSVSAWTQSQLAGTRMVSEKSQECAGCQKSQDLKG